MNFPLRRTVQSAPIQGETDLRPAVPAGTEERSSSTPLNKQKVWKASDLSVQRMERMMNDATVDCIDEGKKLLFDDSLYR